MLGKVTKIMITVFSVIWLTGLIVMITFKNDPIIVACVRTVANSAAGIFGDTREAQKMLWEETKKELKGE